MEEEICNKECMVYSRVVGYYRPVQNWNDGKREEFRQRFEYSEKTALEKQLPNLTKTECVATLAKS